ncbi:unnamed protein product [Penicillium egyptiacum]|uniref:Major facilitator superfamily (MFS) profile domain-containing protein n=1 Tax=Penicillium egyptiacum TaxID=1303716 RepID=A0A9W4KDW9_9EURO|nr:unnamed protein product [Penicillium egyptiacum]
MILYILSYLDRGKHTQLTHLTLYLINNREISATPRLPDSTKILTINLSDYQWSWVLYAFYICYILFEWTTVLWKILPAHSYVAFLCVCWGAAAMCSDAVNTFAQLLATRSLLGLRVSLLLGMSPVANFFASALAYGITHIRGSIEPWRYLFIIEGVPTVLFSVVVFFFLPDSPGSASFLDEREQTEAVERLQSFDTTKKSKVSWPQVLSGLSDCKNCIHMSIHFCCNYFFAGLSNFLPTIIQHVGYTSINAQGLSALPYFVSFLCCVAAAFLSDRWGNRGILITLFATMATIGYLLLTCVQDESKTAARYAGVWLATCGIFPALALNITWLLNNQGGKSKKGAGMAMLAIFGQTSSLISSSVFPDSDAPLYTLGCGLACAFTGLIAILAMGLSIKLTLENRRRDRVYGVVDVNERVDVTDAGDNHPNFRYLT